MDYEWDPVKSRTNIAKHGIGFERAKHIFDGFTLSFEDKRHDYGERRMISIGLLEAVAIVTVVHTDRSGRRRIISARPASKREKRDYERALPPGTDSR